MLPLAAAAAATVATGTYLNAKFSITTDIKNLKLDRQARASIGQRIQELGDTCTLYSVFDRANPEIEALWFEGQTWTYGELKMGRFSTSSLKITIY